eukprot:11896779-Alexandrium_andersonii.AAC.1
MRDFHVRVGTSIRPAFATTVQARRYRRADSGAYKAEPALACMHRAAPCSRCALAGNWMQALTRQRDR